ncbi:hypothetical protein DXG01_013058, partial [Tephrocybe rancida]
LKGQAPETFMRTFLGWCQEAKPLVEDLHGAIVARRHKLEDIRAAKLAFIRDAGLHLSPAARDAALSLMRTLVVKPLDTPYPPKGEIISENSAIRGKWSQRFLCDKLPDKRNKRLPIHNLDPCRLVSDVGPDESICLRDESGKIVGLVIRNFCRNEASLAWADMAAAEQIPDRKHSQFIMTQSPHRQMEDTGKLVQMGYSAGQRNTNKFHWVHNITNTRLKHPDITSSNCRASSLFAFTWQMMQSQLPAEVISDFNSFVQRTGMRRMDADGQLAGLNSCEEPGVRSRYNPNVHGPALKPKRPHAAKKATPRGGTYNVAIGNQNFDFHGAELAPPGGVIGQNYSR